MGNFRAGQMAAIGVCPEPRQNVRSFRASLIETGKARDRKDGLTDGLAHRRNGQRGDTTIMAPARMRPWRRCVGRPKKEGSSGISGKRLWEKLMWTGKYLIRDRGKKQRAHYWTGTDTLCRMWSTGGMRRTQSFFVRDSPDGKEICWMCSNARRAIQTPI